MPQLMIRFRLNGKQIEYHDEASRNLLEFLREHQGITSVKDGCSGQGACGACTIEIDGRARLSCSVKMKNLEGCEVITPEGIPEEVMKVLAGSFVEKGAVQCGFCTPGLIMRTKALFAENPQPTREEIIRTIKPHLCRCTGYIKIIDAIELALDRLRNKITVQETHSDGKAGTRHPKYQAYQLAKGEFHFADDLHFDGMLHAALRFSDHPRAKIRNIDTCAAEKLPGVVRIFTANDIPGNPKTGLIIQDWPLMIAVGETTNYIGDVLAGVVAQNRETARKAAARIKVEYDILEPVTDPQPALSPESPQVHKDQPNLLENCVINRGDFDAAFSSAAFTAEGTFQTQRIEHAFMEVESAVALPEGNGLHLYSQGQGIYVDRRQIASLLNISEDRLKVTQVATGGAFGGKEDLSVQGHTCLFAHHLQKPVKLTLSRGESIRMHPKRHPVWMHMKLGCDKYGILTALYLDAIGDTGAYASVGTKVMERVAGHASGAYHVPNISLQAKTVYTNNIPCGAMRGFGVNQVIFALEILVDELCEKGDFDRWQFRYLNALVPGKATSTGHVLGEGVGVRETLLAVKAAYLDAKYAGIACGIKNSGVGNGMIDDSHVKIRFRHDGKIDIAHGWTEMGQGVHTMAVQIFCSESGIDPSLVEVKVESNDGLNTGMTTSSRATALMGNAIIDACRQIRKDLEHKSAEQLSGNTYLGSFVCDWTTKPGSDTENPVTHFAYGYATQLVTLDDEGKIEKVVAAHDVGKVLNANLFEGQIEGAVHMGLGYALSEDLPMKDGRLLSEKLHKCGVLRSTEMPVVKVIAVEVPDPVGPYGAKGIGEIGLVPTAAAVANSLYQFDGKRRYSLPMNENK